MQNKMFSFAFVLLTSVACFSFSATAQNAPATEMAPLAIQPIQPMPAVKANVPTDKTAEIVKQEPADKADVVKPARPRPPREKKAEKTALPQGKVVDRQKLPNVKLASVEEKAIIPIQKEEQKPMTPEALQEENKRRLEEELKNTTISGKSIVDFPNRSDLGSLELAPIPNINDSSAVRGPTPMEASISGKDLPSEQLLGRITPEVFQEMADLERGNTFLKLQVEKEKLKNDLEKLRATYRQNRLDEISKRENVVRSRIQWWQEQEKLRLAIEKQQAEEDALARKIAEQEATRDRIREEAQRQMAQKKQEKPVKGEKKQPQKQEVVVPQVSMEELYTLDSIRGVNKNLTARIKNKEDGNILTVKKDDILPSGHVVKSITKDTLTVSFGNRVDQLLFRPNMNQ